MNKEQKRILALSRALGMAIGALEVVLIAGGEINYEGLAALIDELKEIGEDND